jgi:hypothetical protein
LRFLFVTVLSLISVAAYGQSEPTSINISKTAILELDLGKGIKNTVIARDDFKRLGAEELAMPPVSGERPSNLIALFSCMGLDESCLTQISKSLKSRFVLYGNLEMSGASEVFTVSLFDAEKAKILSTQTGTFSVEDRTSEMQKLIRKVLSIDGAEGIRVPQKIEEKKEPKESKGLWKFAVPVALSPGIAIFGLRALSTKADAVKTVDIGLDPEDGQKTVSKAERKEVIKAGLPSDVFLVATIGSATWAALSYKKHSKKPAEETASNP